MNILLLAAGSSQAFSQAGHAYPKSLIEVAGQAMIDRVIRCLDPLLQREHRFIAAIRRDENRQFRLGDVIKLIVPSATLVEVEGETGGAACTALLAVEYINNDTPLIIANGDQLIDVDVAKAVDGFVDRKLDAGTITFRGIHPRWSFVRLNEEGLVEEAAEKRPISRSATAGFYYFARGRDFVEATYAMLRKGADTDGLYFVCPTFNEMILKGARIGVVEIPPSAYHSLATPASVETYETLRKTRASGSQEVSSANP